uniref:Microtubule-associated protein 1S n=1 Tax=Lygus hesperus TaxID=30085 RepID=A0A0A9XZC8_LYGHE
MAVVQAAYSVVVLLVVVWYSLMVWRMTDDYFRDEYKRHLRTSASEMARRTHKEEVIPREFKEDPAWLVRRREERERREKQLESQTTEIIENHRDSFVEIITKEENVCYNSIYNYIPVKKENTHC